MKAFSYFNRVVWVQFLLLNFFHASSQEPPVKEIKIDWSTKTVISGKIPLKDFFKIKIVQVPAGYTCANFILIRYTFTTQGNILWANAGMISNVICPVSTPTILSAVKTTTKNSTTTPAAGGTTSVNETMQEYPGNYNPAASPVNSFNFHVEMPLKVGTTQFYTSAKQAHTAQLFYLEQY